MKFLLPTGIGDSVWALHKIESISQKIGDGHIDVLLSHGDASKISKRAVDFVRRFRFVDSVKLRPYELLYPPGITPEGYYNYIPDGMYRFDKDHCCALIPNATLERGQRLESWLPQYDINWDIWKDFRIPWWERYKARVLKEAIGDYVVFYPGPLHGNTTGGHNRGSIWTPQDWVRLALEIHKRFQLPIVVVGANYDAAYYDQLLAPAMNGTQAFDINLIGCTSLGELWSITSGAKFVVSYQAGVGIVSTYLGTPTAIFWRAKGDSLTTDCYLSFEEDMASAWVPPRILMQGKHLPLIYGRHDVDYIMEEVARRGWTQ
jgi:hypothetical protein